MKIFIFFSFLFLTYNNFLEGLVHLEEGVSIKCQIYGSSSDELFRFPFFTAKVYNRYGFQSMDINEEKKLQIGYETVKEKHFFDLKKFVVVISDPSTYKAIYYRGETKGELIIFPINMGRIFARKVSLTEINEGFLLNLTLTPLSFKTGSLQTNFKRYAKNIILKSRPEFMEDFIAEIHPTVMLSALNNSDQFDETLYFIVKKTIIKTKIYEIYDITNRRNSIYICIYDDNKSTDVNSRAKGYEIDFNYYANKGLQIFMSKPSYLKNIESIGMKDEERSSIKMKFVREKQFDYTVFHPFLFLFGQPQFRETLKNEGSINPINDDMKEDIDNGSIQQVSLIFPDYINRKYSIFICIIHKNLLKIHDLFIVRIFTLKPKLLSKRSDEKFYVLLDKIDQNGKKFIQIELKKFNWRIKDFKKSHEYLHEYHFRIFFSSELVLTLPYQENKVIMEPLFLPKPEESQNIMRSYLGGYELEAVSRIPHKLVDLNFS